MVEARPVRLGQREGDSVAVKGGLKEGGRVVVGGLAGLRAGMAVQARGWRPDAGRADQRRLSEGVGYPRR